MIAIRGAGGAIPRALRPLLPADVEIVEVEPADGGRTRPEQRPLPLDADRYLFAEGYLLGQRLAPGLATWSVNFVGVVEAIELILEANDRARICVIGSESGFAGSFDLAYAGAKAALHRYVETRRLRTPQQQLVCVAPGIIGDAGMTTRRHDRARLDVREKAHPKGRWLYAVEVARLVRFLLYEDAGYLTGTVIRMHGGAA